MEYGNYCESTLNSNVIVIIIMLLQLFWRRAKMINCGICRIIYFRIISLAKVGLGLACLWPWPWPWFTGLDLDLDTSGLVTILAILVCQTAFTFTHSYQLAASAKCNVTIYFYYSRQLHPFLSFSTYSSLQTPSWI